jgi:hypothetical protein
MWAQSEKRAMDALFAKKAGSGGGGGGGGAASASYSSSTAKKFEGGGKSSALPSMFGNVNKGGGLNQTMKQDKTTVFDSTTGGAKHKSVSGGGVSKLNMGSAGVMDTSRNAHVNEANRGSFGSKSSGGTLPITSGVSKLNMGSAGVMDRSRSTPVNEANRGSFGKAAPTANKPQPGNTSSVARGPNTQSGVMRKMPWEKS